MTFSTSRFRQARKSNLENGCYFSSEGSEIQNHWMESIYKKAWPNAAFKRKQIKVGAW